MGSTANPQSEADFGRILYEIDQAKRTGSEKPAVPWEEAFGTSKDHYKAVARDFLKAVAEFNPQTEPPNIQATETNDNS